MRTLLGRWILILFIAVFPQVTVGRSSPRSSRLSSHHSKPKCVNCARDSHGRIIRRSPESKRAFRRSHPCPSTGKTSGACPGYVIDHIQPLKRAGADAPNNMQWQTVAAAKAKDRVED